MSQFFARLHSTAQLSDFRTSDNPPPQFKLDIRNAPIQEEEGDADAALANMANTLRAVRKPYCWTCRIRELTFPTASRTTCETIGNAEGPEGRPKYDICTQPSHTGIHHSWRKLDSPASCHNRLQHTHLPSSCTAHTAGLSTVQASHTDTVSR